MIRFRSPSMDVGTAFEMGYVRALGKPVFGYYDAVEFYGESEEPGTMRERVFAAGFMENPDDVYDINDHQVEEFEMPDNLMMVGAYTDSGYPQRSTVYESCLDAVDYIKNNF